MSDIGIQFILFILFISFIFSRLRFRKIVKRLNIAEKKIEALVYALETRQHKQYLPEPTTSSQATAITENPGLSSDSVVETNKIHKPPTPPAKKAPKIQQRPGWWLALEKQLLENWTGILGAAILVTGVTFLSIYSALTVSPFIRTMMITGASILLTGAGRWLTNKKDWVMFGLWLYSIAAALFLLACFGAGAIPGLKWVDDFQTALALMMLGIAANLFLATISTYQSLTSIHIVLSLIPLTIIPQSLLSFTIGTAVTLYGITLASRTRWDSHLLTTISAFTAFHAAWFLRMEMDSAITPLVGRISVLIVALSSALLHYRKNYASTNFQKLPFLVHVTNWTFMGATLGYFYPREMPERSIILMATAIAVLFLARRAKKLGVRWLYLTDTLLAQGLAVAALLFTYKIAPSSLLIPAGLFLETLLFMRIVLREEILLLRAAIIMIMLGAIFLAVMGLQQLSLSLYGASIQNAATIILPALLVGLFEGYLRRISSSRPLLRSVPALSSLGFIAGPLIGLGLMHLTGSPWLGIAALVSLGGLLFLGRNSDSAKPIWGAWIGLLLAHLAVWWLIGASTTQSITDQLLVWGPTVFLSLLAIRLTPNQFKDLIAAHIYLLGINLAFAALFFTYAISPLAPPVLFLTLSLMALETGHRLQEESARAVFRLGYIYLALFFGGYLLYILPATHYMAGIPIRMGIEVLGLMVLGLWWLATLQPTRGRPDPEDVGQSVFLEIALGFLIIIMVVEAPPQWRPIIWALLALACLYAPIDNIHTSRLRFHGLLFFWGSLLNLVVVTSIFQTPSPLWYEQPGLTGALAIMFNILFLILSKNRLSMDAIIFPNRLGWFCALSTQMESRHNRWIYYPFFLGVALFLYWRFDATLLTILWFLLAFMLFVLSVILREIQFRTMALITMGVCLVRLVAFDLTNSDTLIRGLVFLGVGFLMMTMNMIFNKFKGRFQ
jgi:hypothetical protein